VGARGGGSSLPSALVQRFLAQLGLSPAAATSLHSARVGAGSIVLRDHHHRDRVVLRLRLDREEGGDALWVTAQCVGDWERAWTPDDTRRIELGPSKLTLLEAHAGVLHVRGTLLIT
jgi:hypothetical protein